MGAGLALRMRIPHRSRWSIASWDGGAARPIPGRDEASLAERLPDDLRGTAAGLRLGSSFSPLYRTGTEFAAELSNQTVHGVLHLAWVDRGHGRYQGQMAVYVKPRRPARETVHGVHRAVPALGGLSGPAAPDRTGVAGTLAEAGAASPAQSCHTCRLVYYESGLLPDYPGIAVRAG